MTTVDRHDAGLVRWRSSDPARALTIAAAVLTAIAVVLRVVGLPPFAINGPLHHLGIMEPFCGGTRAMYLLTSGDMAGAALYNPMVFPLAAALVLMLVRAVVGWTTGRWLTLRWSPTATKVTWAVVIVALVALTIRQQAHVDLLTNHAH